MNRKTGGSTMHAWHPRNPPRSTPPPIPKPNSVPPLPNLIGSTYEYNCLNDPFLRKNTPVNKKYTTNETNNGSRLNRITPCVPPHRPRTIPIPTPPHPPCHDLFPPSMSITPATPPTSPVHPYAKANETYESTTICPVKKLAPSKSRWLR